MLISFRRGYKTDEVTDMFEKYDTDHDGKLNEAQQKLLKQDLQRQEVRSILKHGTLKTGYIEFA